MSQRRDADAKRRGGGSAVDETLEGRLVKGADRRRAPHRKVKKPKTSTLQPPGRKDKYFDYHYMRAWSTTPTYYAQDLAQMRGRSLGEVVEVIFRGSPSTVQGLDTHWAHQHLGLWVSGRFMWNATQDLNTVLDEYYSKFIGPAGDLLKAYWAYIELNWEVALVGDDTEKAAFKTEQRRLFDLAWDATPDGTVFKQRMQLYKEYLDENGPTDSGDDTAGN